MFEGLKIAEKLSEITASRDKGQTLHSTGYGDVVLKCRTATKEGDGYMSDNFILDAAIKNGTVYRCFTKVPPSANKLRESISEIYNRETAMYSHFFDILKNIREDSGCTSAEIPLNVPEAYYTYLGGKDTPGVVISMEELKYQGYGMVDKHTGSDVAHAKLVLTSLAHYHALTIKFVRQHTTSDGQGVAYPVGAEFLNEPSAFEKVPGSWAGPWNKVNKDLMMLCDREDNAIWLARFDRKLSNFWKAPAFSSLGPMACILHGDCWNNNMLFKYDGAEPVAHKMVDFQISRLGHPLTDVLQFLYSSTLPTTREAHMTYLLTHYFATVTASLVKLGVDLPQESFTFESFHKDYKKLCWESMVTALIVLRKTLLSDDVKRESATSSISELEKRMNRFPAVRVLNNKELCERILGLIDEVKSVYGS